MARYSVSVVEGFRTVYGGSHTRSKLPVEVSILDSAQSHQQVKVFNSGQPWKGMTGGLKREQLIAFAEAECERMNRDERAWEVAEGVQTWAHGLGGYNQHGCRCPICRDANRIATRERRLRRGDRR